MQDSNVESSTVQVILDRVEELVATVIEEIRERPAVAAALLAALVGAIVGSTLAARARRRGLSARARAARRARGLGDVADLLGLGLRLLQNPIVRSLALAAVERQLRRRLPL
jgi:hypothetical protein